MWKLCCVRIVGSGILTTTEVAIIVLIVDIQRKMISVLTEKGELMTQVISKDGVIVCVTTVPYSAEIIKDMKKAGYKIMVEG